MNFDIHHKPIGPARVLAPWPGTPQHITRAHPRRKKNHMPVQIHQVVEMNCPVGHIDGVHVLPHLHHSTPVVQSVLLDRIDSALVECEKTLNPKGTYKLFNPAICTLPPEYTEPAIKIIGTMAVLHGKDIYDRLQDAARCALMAATLGTCQEQEDLREKIGYDSLGSDIYGACLTTIINHTLETMRATLNRSASEEGLYVDNSLRPGEGDLPLNTQSEILFYVQAEKRLGITLVSEGHLSPQASVTSIVGMYAHQKNSRRACGRCAYRKTCSIRAIGMNCHGSKGSFEDVPDTNR